MGRVLHDLGFSPQKPRHVAREQDPEAVERWRKRGLAAYQKKARRRGASIVFIDETGFHLQPVNRRTWAPRGETPVQRAWDRYDRLSVIGAVTLSPTRRHISTPFQIHDDNVRTAEVVAFVKQLRRQLAAAADHLLGPLAGSPLGGQAARRVARQEHRVRVAAGLRPRIESGRAAMESHEVRRTGQLRPGRHA